MAINQLIAQGIRPIGEDLPQIANMLYQRGQQKKQNALAEMNAKTDATRAQAYAAQVGGQVQSAQDAAKREALQRSFDVAAQFPEVMPQFVSDLRQSIAPDLPENASLAQIAMRFKLKVPEQQKPYSINTQPGPNGSTIVTDGARFQVVEPPKPAAPKTRDAPSGYQFNPDGSLSPIKGGPADKTATPDSAAPAKPLPVVLEKRLIDVNDASYGARASSTRYEGIAAEMERVMPSAGARAKWTESLKEITGSEDAVTELRKNYAAVRFSAAVKNLPPGPATDRDIQLALGGFLPDNANPKAIASFLRGLAKMEAIKADYHEFEAAYIAENRTVAGFSKAWQDHAATAYPKADTQQPPQRQVVRRGKTRDGRAVVQYSDGTIEEAR